jgi:hypothetical protein
MPRWDCGYARKGDLEAREGAFEGCAWRSPVEPNRLFEYYIRSDSEKCPAVPSVFFIVVEPDDPWLVHIRVVEMLAHFRWW